MTKPLVAILAGGKSSRMGQPKAALELGGRRLIEWPLQAAADAGLECAVLVKPGQELDDLGTCEIWREPDEPTHPALGLVAALERAASLPVIACACDMPFVTSELFAGLSQDCTGTAVPVSNGRLHPLLARYEQSALGALRAGLDAREPLTKTIESLQPRLLDEAWIGRFGDPEELLFNVNTPADLERAELLLTS